MTRDRRREPVRRSDTAAAKRPAISKSGYPVLKFSALPQNLVADGHRLWNIVIKSPFQALAGAIAFFSSTVTVWDSVRKAFGWNANNASGNSSHLSNHGVLDGLLSTPSGTLLAYTIAACSIGWSIATLTLWLTKSRNDGWNVLGYVMAAIAGLLLSFVSQNFLVTNTFGGAFLPDIGLLLTAAGIMASVLLARVCYRISRELDLEVVEKRALALMIFTLAATASTLLQLSVGK